MSNNGLTEKRQQASCYDSLSHTSICGAHIEGEGVTFGVVKACILAEVNCVKDLISSGWEIISIIVGTNSNIE